MSWFIDDRIAYGLGNIRILGARGATFRCILWSISKN